MKTTLRIAAAVAALAMTAAMTAGCRNEKQITENLAAALAGSELLLAQESGEIMIYESVKLDRDVEGHAVNSVTESYVKFVVADGELEYDLGATVTRVVGGAVTTYDATCENGKFSQFLNLAPVPESEMARPDLFDRFRITFTAADVEKVETADAGGGVTFYSMTMTDAYADSFDTETDGVKYDCERVVYNYYLDAAGILRQVLGEQTATLTDTAGESQEVVKFTQAIFE